jgi:hypothetical protein
MAVPAIESPLNSAPSIVFANQLAKNHQIGAILS